MVGEGQYLVVAQRGCECPTPCGAGCCLQSKTGIALDVHVDHLQRNVQRLAKRAAMRGPVVGGGLQTVVDVDRAQPRVADFGPRAKPVPQHYRIEPRTEEHTSEPQSQMRNPY